MTSRLFVAVVPPDAVRERLDAFLAPRRDAAPQLRWTVPEGWHLTCAFLPAVPEQHEAELIEALDDVAARTTSFALTLEGAGAFPHPDRAKAFWVGVGDGGEQLGQLAHRCRTAARRCGLDVEGGPFHPHLTVARANGISGTGWLEVFGAIEPQTWLVRDFVLIRSQSLPGGAGYRSLAAFELAD